MSRNALILAQTFAGLALVVSGLYFGEWIITLIGLVMSISSCGAATDD